MRHARQLLARAFRDLSLASAGSTRGVLILGMHRSGTSALTGMLADHGLMLVGTVIRGQLDAGASNPRGNLEDRLVRDVNEGLLVSNGGSWDRPAPIRRIPWLLRVRAAQIKRQLTRMPRRWGMKEPRTLVCWELWRDADADRVGTFRHPANVVASLCKRHPERHRAEEWEHTWYVYNRALVDLYRERPFPIVNFDWPVERYRSVVDRIARAFDLSSEGEGFFETKFRRHLGRTDVFDPRVGELYEQLIEISEAEAEKLGS
jgi:hypothetical protein